MSTCINCGAEVTGKYCSNCGQEANVKRLHVKTIVHEVTHGILHWENSILKTIKELLIHPGFFVRDYINGKRKNFIKPFSYFLFLQTGFVLLFHLFSEKFFAFFSNVSVTSDNPAAAKVQAIQNLINQHINTLNFLLPFIFALFFMLFFRKKEKVNYAESLAISFYWFGTNLLFSIVFMALALLEVKLWFLRFPIGFIYLCIAVYQFADISKFRAFLKTLLVYVISTGIFIITVAAVTILYMIFFLK